MKPVTLILTFLLLGQAGFLFAASNNRIETRPTFSLPDLKGKIRHISEWDGKLIILNFWATWCPPCRKEIPEFVKLQDEYRNQDIQFIGVAIDNEQSVSQFAFEMDMNYPNLIAETKGIAIAKNYGNRAGALPYSVIIDRAGKIVYRKTGLLSRKRILDTITSLKE